MLTFDGFYRQIDGLAMGSPPAPMLANGWMSTFDRIIRDNALLYERYMVQFTVEREHNASLAFVDMQINHVDKKLISTWYTKSTDTGLLMNFHALAPKKYKRSVVTGMVHRIFRSCSTYQTFHQSLEKAKSILHRNQYPESFIDPIINDTLNKLFGAKPETEKEEVENTMFFVEYRGKISDQFKKSLHHLNVPCRVIFTLKKLKTVLPSLKPSVNFSLKSGVVYKITCPRCNSCYVGHTRRHLITRIKEHGKPKAPVNIHMEQCNHTLSIDDVIILTSRSRSANHLMTLEALYIHQLSPRLNTKDEYKSRSLVIKF